MSRLLIIAFYLPIVTSIVLSVVLSLFLALFRR
jgi:hypothetical protein